MADVVGKFEKVSFEKFYEEYNTLQYAFGERADSKGEPYGKEEIHSIWETLSLPKRATVDSAGYDFFSPATFCLAPNESVTIPTGIRCSMKKGWWLSCIPKSGLGTKFFLRQANTIGVIDGDYYYSDNEGQIYVRLRNEGDNMVYIKEGDKLFQGIFLPYGIAEDDMTTDTRNGGFGSTGR